MRDDIRQGAGWPTDQCLARLSAEQKAQVLRQVEFHLHAPPSEEVRLNEVVSLHVQIRSGVTRPMSSKALARWLWEHQAYYRDQRVLDVGTGSGLQGLTCLLGGASEAVLSDVTDSAIECAGDNLRTSGLGSRGRVVRSDLFDAMKSEEGEFSLIVFAQPFFAGHPIPEYEFTRGMLDPGDLLVCFFAGARRFLRPSGRMVLMAWDFAGDTNDPTLVGSAQGYRVVSIDTCRDLGGIQQGTFSVIVFE